jgi:hypothetical protein
MRILFLFPCFHIFSSIGSYKQMALDRFLHLQKQILAVQRIVSCWKSWRRYKHSLAFQVLFQIFEFHVRVNRAEEEKLFQQRLAERSEVESSEEEKLKKLREKYFHDLENAKREQLIPIFSSENSMTSAIISSTDLFQWCDPRHETHNSVFNAKRYREWRDKFRIIHQPLSSLSPSSPREPQPPLGPVPLSDLTPHRMP